MAGNAISNTFMTYSAKGIREDLTDVIWNVSPAITPFVTSIAKTKSTQTTHQWQTDSLASASSSNAQVQGDDITSFDAVTATSQLTNYTQISRKTLIISGSEEKAIKAGRKSEVSYQLVKKGKELRRDIEAVLLSNQAKVIASGGTAPTTASVLSWIKTNTVKGAGGSDPSAADGTGTRTDGTQVNATEAQLKTVLQDIFTNSADEPDMILVGPSLKQTYSTFSGNATRYKDADDKKLVAAIDVYVSDFGSTRIVPDRFMRTREALVINSDLWAMAWFRPIQMDELAKSGDATKRMILGEYALEARNEAGNGGVFDIQ